MEGIDNSTSSIEFRRKMEDRLLTFGADLLELSANLEKSNAGRIVINQLLRSGTSVGANFEEATAAESRADFIHKLQISLKEARETCYWLRLLSRSHHFESAKLNSLVNEGLQIRAILTKSVFTAKEKYAHE